MEFHKLDLQEFMSVLDSCKGNVFMVTDEGDRVNLKSKLCQMIGFTKLIAGGQITVVRIECEKEEDEQKLFRFNLFGAKGIDAK